MKLEDLLKDSPDILAAVNAAIARANEGETDKLKHVRFADLSEGGYVSKDKYTSLETDLSGKTSELEKANGLIAELKKTTGKDEESQQKITAYEAEITNLKKENEELKTENALKFALLSAGAVDVDYLVFKAKEKGEIKLGDDGKIKGEDDLISGLKTQLPGQFAPKGKGSYEGFKLIDKDNQQQNQGMTKAELLRKPYPERMKFFNENPETYKEIMKG